VINWFEDLFEDMLQMVIRGFEVVAMVLWYGTLYNFSHLEVSGGLAQSHMDLFWAATATFLGAIFMVVLESMEQNLKRIKEADGVPEGASHWTDSVILLSDVIQSVFGFVTGCAWSDWLFETVTVLNADPTVPVIFTNLAIVLLLTILSCYWLIMNASTEGIDESLTLTEAQKKARAEALATDRGEVEKQFFAGALGFFVLGGWLVVVKNLFAPFMVLVEMAIAWSDSTFGLHIHKKTGDTIAVLVFAPVFTVVAFAVAGRVMEGFAKKAGVDEAPKGKAAATEAAKAGSKTRRRSSTTAYYDKNYQDRSSKELV